MDALAAIPPRGCSLIDDGTTIRIRASTRSVVMGVFLTVFTGIWNTVTWAFVAIGVGSLYSHAVASMSSAAPSLPGGAKLMPVVFAIGLLIFTIPFVAIGLFTLFAALSSYVGHVEVSLRDGQGEIFTGIGSLGRRKRFDATSVTKVYVDTVRSDESSTHYIVLDMPKKLKFGSMLLKDRREWVVAVLGALLVPTSAGTPRRAILPTHPEARP